MPDVPGGHPAGVGLEFPPRSRRRCRGSGRSIRGGIASSNTRTGSPDSRFRGAAPRAESESRECPRSWRRPGGRSSGDVGPWTGPEFAANMLPIASVNNLAARPEWSRQVIRRYCRDGDCSNFIRARLLRPVMVRAVKPTRKRDGRLGPPQGYPKDPEKYADPANWKYPVHTPFHARAARRYFNEPRNRAKYTPEEQAYVDKKINEALERFGVAVKIKGGQIEDEAGTIQADVPMNKDIDKMTFAELLPVFLGTNRPASAKAIDPSVVSVDKETDTLLAGRGKDLSGSVHPQEERG